MIVRACIVGLAALSFAAHDTRTAEARTVALGDVMIPTDLLNSADVTCTASIDIFGCMATFTVRSISTRSGEPSSTTTTITTPVRPGTWGTIKALYR